MMIGRHLVMHWCRLQDRIALSSGEAELYSGVRGISEAINLFEMTQEMHPTQTFKITHHVDAVACKGILLRHGAGQLKHLDGNFALRGALHMSHTNEFALMTA